MQKTPRLHTILAPLLCVATFAWLPGPAAAVELAGVHIDDSAQVGGTALKLNGAGIRTKVIFKVYVAALYLPEKKTALPEVMASPGPRRIEMVMLRDLSAEKLTEALMEGLHNNSDKAELTRLGSQVAQLEKTLASAGGAKKGDILLLDWIPGEGTVTQLNGKRLGSPLADLAFYNALMKIWLGDKPADSDLKPQLLGSKA